MERLEPKELTGIITDYLNVFSVDDKIGKFNDAMSREHRTLQQSFTRLCIGWIEHVASDDYYTDGRNQASKNFGVLMKKLFEDYSKTQQNDGELMYIIQNFELHRQLPLV
jgi:hypothetical protein